MPKTDLRQIVAEARTYSTELAVPNGSPPDREATQAISARIDNARGELRYAVRATASADTWQLVHDFLASCHEVASFVEGSASRGEFKRGLAARAEHLLDQLEVHRTLCAIHERSESLRGERLLTEVMAELDELRKRGAKLRSDLDSYLGELAGVLSDQG